MNKLKPCPFCGGKARLTAKQAYFHGYSFNGARICWRIRVMCNKCHTLGPCFTTDETTEIFWHSSFAGKPQSRKSCDQPFAETVEKVIEAWNRRAGDEA